MKSTRYTEEQIIRIQREVESGKAVAPVCPGWHSKSRDMDQGYLRRLRELEAENDRLKKIMTQQTIDLDSLRELVRELRTGLELRSSHQNVQLLGPPWPRARV